MKVLRLIVAYKWALVLIAVASFLFYWYEMRPIVAYRICGAQSSADARALLQSKSDLAGDTRQGDAYRGLIEKNLYLRSDYESFLLKCLMSYGYQIEPIDDAVIPQEAVAADEE